MLNQLLLPLQFDFMLQAFAVAALLSVPMALLSCYIVLKGWSLMGDAIAHAVLPGIVVAYLLALPLAVGAFVAGLCCASATSYIKNNTKLREDTVMGIVFSTMFAAGVLLFHSVETDLHLTHLILGDLLGVTRSSLVETALIALFVLAVLLLRGRDILLLVFDPQQAHISGANLSLWRYLFQALLALIIVSALQSVGMILSIALLIAPGACALLLTKRFSRMLWIAASLALASSVFGVYASFYLDSAPAATIVLLLTFVFILLFIKQGVVRLRVRKRHSAERVNEMRAEQTPQRASQH
ncbi:MAG: metal ABC transporter permease [Pseudomonadales bacterium]